MKRIIILTMLLFPFILVCSQGKYHINGILNNDYNGKYVKLFQFQGDTLITSIDSAKVQKGKFSFKGKANVDEFAIVTIGKYPYIKSVEVVLEEGDIRVYMDTAFVASGTPLNDLRNSLNSEVTRLCGVWYDLMIKSDTIDVERDKAHDDYQKFIYNATIENRLNLVGRRFIADNKSAIWPLENLVKLHEQLEALQKNNSLVTQADIKKFKELLDKQAAFTKKQEETANSQYFDFVLQDTLGIQRSISEYVGKSRLLFVDFWASWCSPCRADIPHIKEVYEKYKDKGLNVLAISFDSNKAAWKSALKKLKMPWEQLIEVNGTNSDLAKAYQIYGIPYGILLDSEGTIIAVRLDAQSLEEFLLKEGLK